MHGTRHSQNAGLGRHFPMGAHEAAVEPRKTGIVFPPRPNDRDNISTTVGHPLRLMKMYNVLFKTR